MSIEARIATLGLTLHQPVRPPSNARFPFAFVNVVGDRAIIAGHGPTAPDGQMCGPYGKVGAEVSRDEAYQAARRTGMAILASLQAELGSLDRVVRWVKVLGMVNSAPGFAEQPAVINGFSDLILDIWGPEAGRHARSAVGMAELPFRIPVEIEAEVVIRP